MIMEPPNILFEESQDVTFVNEIESPKAETTRGKVFGAILLIIGTSVGGGMLALPMAIAAGGYYHSIFLFFGAWLITVLAAFYILEANLWLPENTNLISMARITLGKAGQLITWISYLLLLYTLLAAYMSGGTDLIHNLLSLINIPTPTCLDSILFVVILGAVLFYGVRAVDWVNRGLMSTKLAVYFLLVLFISPHIDVGKLSGGRLALLSGAVMVIITSFGYATIVPTLRSYLKSQVNALRLTIAIGSLMPLILYLLWTFVVNGTLGSHGANGLIHMAASTDAVSELSNTLSAHVNGELVKGLIHFFTSICIATSFLGVSLCLSDFMADGLKIKKEKNGRWLLVALTLAPPLLVILFYPGAFIASLNYAGVLCVILLILLPALMVWSGRYVKKIAIGYEVIGGKTFIILEILVALALLIFALMHLG
ncbi:amino acid permease [Coxiella burnetii]|uniref:amino acid permease n=1 Tax=Coxiella burnetii TaxID=777 RepID=UPI000183CED6|nr:aromatic amino acid transport family protein [Coxiella burnetii]ACJ17896.1 tyrosine-specific transport protein [Coxiella burnetii CbuG_Q212]OYK86727.1 tryptophan/tyrosine permease [Coxiella burnetii]